jgi:hypothetical protein
MFQVSERQTSQCFLCSTTDVVELKKEGQNVKLCKRHLWDALNNGKKDAKKPSGKGAKESSEKQGAEQ